MEKSEYARALEILDRYIYYARFTRQDVIVNVSVFDYAKQKGNAGDFLPVNLLKENFQDLVLYTNKNFCKLKIDHNELIIIPVFNFVEKIQESI